MSNERFMILVGAIGGPIDAVLCPLCRGIMQPLVILVVAICFEWISVENRMRDLVNHVIEGSTFPQVAEGGRYSPTARFTKSSAVSALIFALSKVSPRSLA